jgi:hypothetical protein
MSQIVLFLLILQILQYNPAVPLANVMNQRLRVLGWAFTEGADLDLDVEQIFVVSEAEKLVAIELNDYLQRLKKVKIPTNFKNFLDGCEARRQRFLANLPICPRLKRFGHCPGSLPLCTPGTVRHFFAESDRPPEFFPLRGDLICELDEILDATAFRGRIFQQILSAEKNEKFDPPLEAEIIFAGFVPLDADLNWTPGVVKYVESFVLKKKVRCRIRLALGSTVWTEHVIVLVPKANGQYLETTFMLQEELLQQQLAARNPGHIDALIQLCSTSPQLKVSNS